MSVLPAFKSAGAGDRLLVFLHGIGGNQDSFDEQLAAFSGQWRAIAWDMPGYGRSPAPARLTWPALAEALAALLDHAGAARAVIVGHSMGGMVLQEFAVRYPERLAAQVLYATTAAFGGGDGTFQAQFLARRLAPIDRGLTPADIAAELVGDMLGPSTPSEVKSRAVASMAAVNAAAYRAAIGCLVTFDRREDLAGITCPTLVLAAELDQLSPPKTMARMATLIPGAQYECLTGVGHLAHLEAPDRFNAALAAFLGTLADKDAGSCTRI